MSPEVKVEKITGIATFRRNIGRGKTKEYTVLYFTSEDDKELALTTDLLPTRETITVGTTIIYSRKSEIQKRNGFRIIRPEHGEKFGIINPKGSEEE